MQKQVHAKSFLTVLKVEIDVAAFRGPAPSFLSRRVP